MAITGELVGLFVMLIGAIGGLWWKIESKIQSETDERVKVQRELSDLRLHVAQNYVSSAALRETELRLINAVERLATRMEAVVTRLDKISLRQQQRDEEE